jgi:hypothetical protein
MANFSYGKRRSKKDQIKALNSKGKNWVKIVPKNHVVFYPRIFDRHVPS